MIFYAQSAFVTIGFVGIVGSDNQDSASVLLTCYDPLDHFETRRVEVNARLVEQQDGRRSEHRSREFHALLHSRRKRANEIIGALCQLDHLQNLAHLLIGIGEPPSAGNEAKVFSRGEPVVDVHIWSDESDA